MSRRKNKIFKREASSDIRYNSELIQKFINVVMRKGKKSIACSIVYDAFDILSKKVSGDKSRGADSFFKAIGKITPAVEVRPRRVGGSVYQVPAEVRPERARALTLRWLIEAAKARSDKTMALRLAAELLDACEGRGAAVKKRLDVHKMAESNRAFSHYSW